MHLYKTMKGILIRVDGTAYLHEADWDGFVNDDNLFTKVNDLVAGIEPLNNADELFKNALLAPIGSQEIWASGVTYKRSREARMDEAKDAGGSDFYDRVYEADRPELFFKATSHRTAGSGEAVRIRKDSKWNVPEPELTLFIGTSGKIIGYTIGNDMSSRDIEGENPLYLPQAKTYDKSAGLGPGLYITNEPLPQETRIMLEIHRNRVLLWSDAIEISQIKRKLTTLVEYLFREASFPYGAFLMTGTGIVPPNEFTLDHGDEIRISIDRIGTLINRVE